MSMSPNSALGLVIILIVLACVAVVVLGIAILGHIASCLSGTIWQSHQA